MQYGYIGTSFGYCGDARTPMSVRVELY